jgi:tRNA-modifying protein YgfZ
MSDTSRSESFAQARVPLDRAELIEIAGADAIAFAHAQFSSDVTRLAEGDWQWSAWLSAQGRVRCVFALLRVGDDRLLLWLPLGGARAIRDALARYVLRAKVQIHFLGEWSLWRVDGDATAAMPPHRVVDLEGGYALAQPGSVPRVAWLAPSPVIEPDPHALDVWRRADVAAGLPWLALPTQDAFVPQALDLERIDAIRFDKGCFPGQEIAARLHFRGGAKQHLHRAALRGDADIAPGLRIDVDGASAGIVLYGARVSVDTHEALIVLADASLDSARLVSSDRHAVSLLYGYL